MATEPTGSHGETTGENPAARGVFQATDTGRVEAFSDGVFAVAITILALDMTTPAHREGRLGSGLLHQWPAYLGYLTSFAYIGVIWLNHHQAFRRIRVVDRGLQAANLAVLFATAALPFPTGVVSDALEEGVGSDDVRTAVVLYAVVAAALCAGWFSVYVQLTRRPGLLHDSVEARYVPHGLIRTAAGFVAYLVAGALGWAVAPAIALAVFLLLPLFYFATSEGLPRALRRPPNR